MRVWDTDKVKDFAATVMGGGLIMEDVYGPYHCSFPGFHNSPYYAVSSTPSRYYNFHGQSPLAELVAAVQSASNRNRNLYGQGNEAASQRVRNAARKEETSKSDEGAVHAIQVPVTSKASVARPEQESFFPEEKTTSSTDVARSPPEERISAPSLHSEAQNMEIASKSSERTESSETEEVEQSAQPEQMETTQQSEDIDCESGSDDERRAATVVQARYRGHLVRMSRPLVQLRAIAEVGKKLKELKQQAQSDAFVEELRRERSMAKLAFDEGTMKLLLQLDDIQGSHPLVRQIRKTVTREIISLQESVDALVLQSFKSSR